MGTEKNRLNDNRPQSEVQVGPDKLEVVASFATLVTCFLLLDTVK